MSGLVLIPTQVASTTGVTGTAASPLIVDKCVAYNLGTADVTVLLHICPAGSGGASALNRVGRVVIPTLSTAYCAQLVGAWLAAGDSIVLIPDLAAVLVVYAGARQ